MPLHTGRWFDMRDGTYLRVGDGPFDGWYFRKHADGYLVSVEKAKEVTVTTVTTAHYGRVVIEDVP